LRDLFEIGPVGRDLARVDWASTPLGVPAGWPRSLTAVLQVVLSSRFSMWMAWGEELTFFCNDAYRRDTLAGKYPWALGRPASEVWAEIWDDIGPRIDAVLQTGEATWDEALLLFLERSGFREETYHTFSYSPLTGDDDAIVGMLCVVAEETERVIGERHLATLRDLGTALAGERDEDRLLAAAAAALESDRRSLPFCALYLADADGPGAHLALTSGIQAGTPGAPEHLDPHSAAVWPVARALAGEAVLVDGLGDLVADRPCGAWDTPPEQAIVLPLAQQGQERPLGLLVAALNPLRPFDAPSRSFVELVAGQLAAGIASARAYGEERRRAEELAELDRAKTAFFTNVSHELRTPLTLLLGPAEDALVDDAEPLPAGQRHRVEVIARNGRRLLTLVNTLLDVQRLESGQASARFEPVDLPRLTTELASMFEAATERAGLELRVACPPLDQPVLVDREMWSKIVLNLLSNAVKHTFEGEIALRLGTEDGAAVLEVADTGVGIAPEDQERLFERFVRLDTASRTHEGTGIGLALVAELAELHGGGVDVRSTVGEGSTFTVRVPLGDAHVPAAQRPAAGAAAVAELPAGPAEELLAETLRWLADDQARNPAPADPKAGRGGRARVLVADDNADMRGYIAELLAAEHDVVTVADGQAALEAARETPPDLVLTDVMMPRLDGFGLLRALQEDPATTHVPVIMVSARGGEDRTVEGLEAGADDYLVKPFSARELLARVRANLELDRVRRTSHELDRTRSLLEQAEHLAGVGSWELDLASGGLRASRELRRQLHLEGLDDSGPERLAQALLERVHPEDRDRVRAELVRGAHGAALDYEVRIVGPDDGVRFYRTIAEPIRDDLGHVVALRGSNQDVTGQREAERAREVAAAAREAAAREHEIADELQRSLLPARNPQPDRLDVATYYRAGTAGTQVGGDWYDVIELAAGRTAVVMGDVMGRGVRAAAVMGQVRAAIRAYARLDLAPGDVLALLDGVVGDLDESQIVTCIYAIYDPIDGQLQWASAGHVPPLLLAPDGSVRRLSERPGPPLGSGLPQQPDHVVELPAGTMLVLYTDGLVERRGESLDVRLDELAGRLASAGVPLEALPDELVRGMVGDELDDDVALLVARAVDLELPPAEVVALPAEPVGVREARRVLGAALERWDVDRTLAADAALVVTELVTNAVLHGRGPIDLRLRLAPRHLVVEVQDGTQVLPRRRRAGAEDEGGRGLQLVSALTERWGTRPLPEGKAVWCLLRLPAAG
jgi:signal transduction histidine kinase/DNA-binding response OmpR family regulator/serine phosphatase RsbU (regulator of sigma subunit)